MSSVALPAALIAVAWGGVGLAVGALVRWGSVRLARMERLEPGAAWWQAYGPPSMTAALFAAFAWRIGPEPLLLVRSLWAAVLVQVIFFDFEHQLILDRVLLPASAAALALSAVTPNLGLLPALLTGVATGAVFLAVAALGSVVFRTEAMGLGDVKFSVFLGLILGPQLTLDAVLVGLILAGVIAVGLVLLRLRRMRDSIAYGPFLAAGALAALLTLGP